MGNKKIYYGTMFDLYDQTKKSEPKTSHKGRIHIKDLPIDIEEIFAVKFFSNGFSEIRRVTKKNEKTVVIDKAEFPENLWNFIEIYPITNESIDQVLIQGRERLKIFLERSKKESWLKKYEDVLGSS